MEVSFIGQVDIGPPSCRRQQEFARNRVSRPIAGMLI